MNILASVTNKNGLAEFIKGMDDVNVYSTGGTQKYLNENGIKSISIESLTGFRDIFDGRVKTLHPSIFSGLLYRDENDLKLLDKMGYVPFHMLICNLYEFEKFKESTEQEKIEHIDIGGVSLIRAAAKNWKNVAVVTDVNDYHTVLKEIKELGDVSQNTKKYLMKKAFRLTSAYDSVIYNSYRDDNDPDLLVINSENGKVLRYGENPSQRGIFISDDSGQYEILQGKEMSYNNYMDASSAIQTIMEFENENAAVVIKHNTPCGAAVKKKLSDALKYAILADEESAYGSVIAVNGIFDEDCESVIDKRFVEIIIAKDFTPEALFKLSRKKNLRVIKYKGKDHNSNVKSIFGGYLLQSKMIVKPEKIDVVNGKVEERELKDLLFAWKIVAHCRSNAIVLAKDGVTVGIGAGQTSRVEATRIAVRRAGENAKNSVMASDAYLPFPDNVEEAGRVGICSIIEPGGSIRDKEVIEKCRELNISLVFTGNRVFLH
ncbi:bifunctional phosphoribosylaminoimidazolecarboxamide formyltransferase/IMP cyclohydrolase [Caldiplasma sukawensis]